MHSHGDATLRLLMMHYSFATHHQKTICNLSSIIVTSKSTHNSNAAISCKDIKSERCDLPQNSTVSLNDKGGFKNNEYLQR